MKEEVRIDLHISESLKEHLQLLADQDGRSLMREIEHALELYWKIRKALQQRMDDMKNNQHKIILQLINEVMEIHLKGLDGL